MKKTRKIEENLTALLLIDITLDLIEKHGGCRGVNLRNIARKAGCAHTNVYNYFHSLEDLFWNAMEKAIKRLVQYSVDKTNRIEGEDYFKIFISSQIENAINHPALYHFIFFEQLKGSPPKEFKKYVQEMGEEFAKRIFTQKKDQFNKQEKLHIGDLIHAYLHGEICKLISGRYFNENNEEKKSEIISNTQNLFDLLTSQLKRNMFTGVKQ